MAIDFKVETPDTTLDVASALLFGADSQASVKAVPYPAVRLSNALATETKTLTNKTLASPVVNTLVHADGGVLTVPNSTGTIARLEDIGPGSGYTSPLVSRGQMIRRGVAADEPYDLGNPGSFMVAGPLDPTWMDIGTVSVMDPRYGVTGDGATDDTAAIQACIDANKGKVIMFPRGSYLVGTTAALLLSGSTYNGTTLCGAPDATIIMAVRPTSTTYNFTGFGSGWAALIVKDAYGVTICGLNFNGQRTLQPPNEFAHTLIIAGCTRTKIYSCKFSELRGDGLYISQSDLSSSSGNSRHMEIYGCEFWNDEADGRNAISIVGCDDGTICGIKSYNVGGSILYPTTTVTCTVTVANPAVFTKSAHGLAEDTALSFDSSGTMWTGLSNSRSGKIYYVLASGLTANEFQVALSPGGTAVEVTGAGTGTLSYNTGTLVVEPGGIDFEPNNADQSNKRWTVDNIHVVHEGTGGLSIQGRPGGTEVTRDISASNIVLINTALSHHKDSVTSTHTQNTFIGNLRVVWADNVVVRGAVCRFTNTYGIGPIVSDSTGVTLEAHAYKLYIGANIGAESYDDIGVGARGVMNSKITLHLSDISRFGIIAGHLTDVTIGGDVGEPSAAYYTAVFGVLVSKQGYTMTQTDVSYEVSVRPSTVWTRSYRADAGNTPTLTRITRQNCNLGANDSTGWTAAVNQIGDVSMANRNVTGVTNRASIPTAGGWQAGTFVSNDGAAIGTPSANKILQGWQRVTTGTGNVAATDWHLCVIANS